MKHLRFWQKTYLLTLLLFLICLGSAVIYIGRQNQKQTLQNLVDKCKSEQSFIARNLQQDSSILWSGIDITQQFSTYLNYYEQEGILLEIFNEQEDVLVSNLPEYTGSRQELTIDTATQSWLMRTVNKETYIYITSYFGEEADPYILTYARSLSELMDEWKEMRNLLAVSSILAAAVLAVGLFVILKSLSKPLEKLALTADHFAAGDLNVRAKVSSQDEIGDLARSFNHMAIELQQNIESLTKIAEQNERMAANLTHEIRTPLTAIQGYAEYMRLAYLTEEEQDSSLSYIISESNRLQKVSRRMLQIFRLSHEELKLDTVYLDIVVRQVMKTMEIRAADQKVQILLIKDEKICVKGDEVLLESLVINLLDNAIKASMPGKQIALSVFRQDENGIIRIVDQGTGMSQETLNKLGEPFYRPDKARSRAEGGAGLGVSLCYQIVEIHGANMVYTSGLGHGTTVTVEFIIS